MLSVGRFIYSKGFDVLAEIWEEVEDAVLIIIGNGEKLYEYLDTIKKHQINNVVILEHRSF